MSPRKPCGVRYQQFDSRLMGRSYPPAHDLCLGPVAAVLCGAAARGVRVHRTGALPPKGAAGVERGGKESLGRTSRRGRRRPRQLHLGGSTQGEGTCLMSTRTPCLWRRPARRTALRNSTCRAAGGSSPACLRQGVGDSLTLPRACHEGKLGARQLQPFQSLGERQTVASLGARPRFEANHWPTRDVPRTAASPVGQSRTGAGSRRSETMSSSQTRPPHSRRRRAKPPVLPQAGHRSFRRLEAGRCSGTQAPIAEPRPWWHRGQGGFAPP